MSLRPWQQSDRSCALLWHSLHANCAQPDDSGQAEESVGRARSSFLVRPRTCRLPGGGPALFDSALECGKPLAGRRRRPVRHDGFRARDRTGNQIGARRPQGEPGCRRPNRGRRVGCAGRTPAYVGRRRPAASGRRRVTRRAAALPEPARLDRIEDRKPLLSFVIARGWHDHAISRVRLIRDRNMLARRFRQPRVRRSDGRM